MSTHLTVTSIDRARILKSASTIGMLGSGARNAPRIIAALCDPGVSAAGIAALVAEEPTLYARVLRVANSAYYGQSRSVSSVERALVLLGVDAVRGIAAAACLDRTFARAANDGMVNMRAMIHHSHATAAAADSLARISHPALAPEVFIAGLLHNLGVAVQVQLDTPAVRAIIDLRRNGDRRDIRVLESEQSAVSHEECAAVIFDAWQLPQSLIAGIRHHHDPMMAPEPHREVAALVNLGATVGLAVGSTHTLEPIAVEHNAPAMARLGVSAEQLESVTRALPDRLAHLSRALA